MGDGMDAGLRRPELQRIMWSDAFGTIDHISGYIRDSLPLLPQAVKALFQYLHPKFEIGTRMILKYSLLPFPDVEDNWCNNRLTGARHFASLGAETHDTLTLHQHSFNPTITTLNRNLTHQPPCQPPGQR